MKDSQLKSLRYHFNLILLTAALALPLVATTTALAAHSDLDPTFGASGKLVSPITDFDDYPYSMQIQPDGKIVVSGKVHTYNAASSFLARFNGNGTLDDSFGATGKIVAPVNKGEYFYYCALQSDGKIVLAGYKETGGINTKRVFAVARYNPNGTLDTTFGSSGKTFISIGNNFAAATNLGIQPDGKIVVIGYSQRRGGKYDFATLRYNSDGSLDDSFGTDGKVITAFGNDDDHARAIALQPDGKIIVAGYGYGRDGSDIEIARYHSTGAPDSTFGAGGKITTSISSYDFATDVALQADGKIVIGTYDTIVRYNSDGSLDRTFAANGIFNTNDGVGGTFNAGYSIAIQPDGKIIGLGDVTYLVPVIAEEDKPILDARKQRNFSRSSMPNSPENADSPNGFYDFALIRLNPNGTPDASFGNGGRVETGIRDYSFGSVVKLQPDGKILACGNTGNYSDDVAIVRYRGNAARQSPVRFDFDGDGKADLGVFRLSAAIWYVLNSQTGFFGVQLGTSSDRIVPADFDYDDKTDVAVFRNGTWFWIDSSDGRLFEMPFGQTDDVPVPANYTGDERDELAVYRAGFWYLLDLSTNQFSTIQFGTSLDRPIPADYDGDGKTDAAFYRNGFWYLLQSRDGLRLVKFGLRADTPVPADYDGDGKADIAIFRGGVWYLQQSSAGFAEIQFGLSTDKPVPADYDGDGKTDAAVFRNGVWYIQQSTSGFAGFAFGTASDIPVEAAYLP